MMLGAIKKAMIIRTLVISYYPSTNPNLIECAKNYSDIKTLEKNRIP